MKNISTQPVVVLFRSWDFCETDISNYPAICWCLLPKDGTAAAHMLCRAAIDKKQNPADMMRMVGLERNMTPLHWFVTQHYFFLHLIIVLL